MTDARQFSEKQETASVGFDQQGRAHQARLRFGRHAQQQRQEAENEVDGKKIISRFTSAKRCELTAMLGLRVERCTTLDAGPMT